MSLSRRTALARSILARRDRLADDWQLDRPETFLRPESSSKQWTFR